MTFSDAISTCFSKYATFDGRAARSEFWWFYLFRTIISVVLVVLQLVSDGNMLVSLLQMVVAVGLFLPGLAVSVRRLHDTDHSGWLLLLVLIPLVGAIIVLVWFCSRGTGGANRFGDDPLEGLGEVFA